MLTCKDNWDTTAEFVCSDSERKLGGYYEVFLGLIGYMPVIRRAVLFFGLFLVVGFGLRISCHFLTRYNSYGPPLIKAILINYGSNWAARWQIDLQRLFPFYYYPAECLKKSSIFTVWGSSLCPPYTPTGWDFFQLKKKK